MRAASVAYLIVLQPETQARTENNTGKYKYSHREFVESVQHKYALGVITDEEVRTCTRIHAHARNAMTRGEERNVTHVAATTALSLIHI